MHTFDMPPVYGDRPADYADSSGSYDCFVADGYDLEAVTADNDQTDLPDDLPEISDPDQFAVGVNLDDIAAEERIKESFGNANPWDGLDDWAESFDPTSLPSYLGDSRLAHFKVGIDIDQPADVEVWAKILREGYDATKMTLDGDLERAAACMAAFERGVKFVYDAFAEKGVVEEVPVIRIVSDLFLSESEAALAATADELYVNGLALEDAAMWPADEIIVAPPPETGQPAGKVGTIEEMYYLGGVEEAHHSIHERHMPPAEAADRSLPHIMYHTNEREYQALRWKLMAARQAGMSPAMVGALEHTYRAATELRRQNKRALEEHRTESS